MKYKFNLVINKGGKQKSETIIMNEIKVFALATSRKQGWTRLPFEDICM